MFNFYDGGQLYGWGSPHKTHDYLQVTGKRSHVWLARKSTLGGFELTVTVLMRESCHHYICTNPPSQGDSKILHVSCDFIFV